MIIQRRCLQEAFLRDSIHMKFPEQLNPQTESRSVEKGGLASDSVELDGGEACQQCECSRTSACRSSDGHAGTHTEKQLLDTFGCFVFKDKVSFCPSGWPRT